jgi:predicted ABC-class ATPase
MRTAVHVKGILRRIDNRGYKAYQDIKGECDFDTYSLFVDYVQGDPFAAPSRMRVRISIKESGFTPEKFSNKIRRIALGDFIARCFADACRRYTRGNRGTGKSGLIAIDQPGQEILERTAVIIDDQYVEARFRVGLPAFGRRIAARHAEEMLFEELPRIVTNALRYQALDREKLGTHIETAEDADFLRQKIVEMGFIAFIADGSILPRASGIDNSPLKKGAVVPFQTPDSFRVSLDLPNRGEVTGMGIPRGVTLIVGGGYHGKSTLLNAVELGVYNHIPGDGREFVVSDPTLMKIRAEDGRRIEKVDISPFISNLPFGKNTGDFSTDDASGSTSQAANIIEALESGAGVIVMDEDTSATNFMIRDHRMQDLVSKDHEPITPFIDKVRQLYSDLGVSTILVIGGSGDYFDVADHVMCMEEYRPLDVTKKAYAIAEQYRAERRPEGGAHFGRVTPRIPQAGSFDASRGKRDVKISSKGLQTIDFGTHRIDLGAVEQLVDISQTRAIGDAIQYATRYMDGRRSMKQVIDLIMNELDRSGLEILNRIPVGDYACFRGLEFAAAVNRLRTLSVRIR